MPPALVSERPISNWPASESAEEEEQHRHQREEGGGLELESPAELAASGAQDQQNGDDDPEGDEDAERVDPAVAAQAVALMPEDWTSARPLMKRTGKTHGIRLRRMPPMNASAMAPSTPEELRERHGGRRCSAGRGVDLVCAVPSGSSSRPLSFWRGGLEVLVFGERRAECRSMCGCGGLRRGVGDDGFIEREELGGGGLRAGELRTRSSSRKKRTSRSPRRARPWGVAPEAGDRPCAPIVGGGRRGRVRVARAGGGEVGFAGDADCAADQPGDVGGRVDSIARA